MSDKPTIAFIASSNATILSSPPLVTSNKARQARALPLRRNPDGGEPRFDALRPQRLAAPVVVYVEQFSAHPLERDAAELYGPPDGYLNTRGEFLAVRQSADDKPVFRIELRPEDGLYPLPYMATQADGSAWDDDGARPLALKDEARQPFYPDGHRLIEEIDRLSIEADGSVNSISSRVDLEFHRVAPSSGYTKGLAAYHGTASQTVDIPNEKHGVDYFPYRPVHLTADPPRKTLGVIVNSVTEIIGSSSCCGIIWAQGSPRIEETLYWLNLLIDADVPICGVAAQRAHQEMSADGPRNILDAVEFVISRAWSSEAGENRLVAVLVSERQIFAARDVQKGDARPGGYVATGGHGGILGGFGYSNQLSINYLPTTRHAKGSLVNLSRLPDHVMGVRQADADADLARVRIEIKSSGRLVEDAIPYVSIIKDGNYQSDEAPADADAEADVRALVETRLRRGALAGFVMEGLSPYGTPTSRSRLAALKLAVCCGMPVVKVGRGNNEGFTAPSDLMIGGRNLTATKARLLLMACLMRFGSLPPAKDPYNPDAQELDEIRLGLKLYQSVFDTH